MRKLLIAAALWLCSLAPALAQTCPAYSFTFTPNTTIRSAQVNANFNTILTCANNSLAPLASPAFTGVVTMANPLGVASGGTGNTSGQPSGTAGGDLTGSFYPNPTVALISNASGSGAGGNVWYGKSGAGGAQINFPAGKTALIGVNNSATGLSVDGSGNVAASGTVAGTQLIVGATQIHGIAQIVNTETGAVNTGATVMNGNVDTIPTNATGDQYMSLAITPTNASSTCIIDIVWRGETSGAGTLSVALFQDATVNALAAVSQDTRSAGAIQNIAFRHKMTCGTVAATTFKVRAGGAGAGTTTFNGVSGGRTLGGVSASSMTITEILP